MKRTGTTLMATGLMVIGLTGLSACGFLSSSSTTTSSAASPISEEIPEPPLLLAPPVPLPAPSSETTGDLSILLDQRHSTRVFADTPLTEEQLATLLWATYGLRTDGGRTVPSAGGIYSLTIFVVAGEVDGLSSGVYAWDPLTNELGPTVEGDIREELQIAALDQDSVGAAPAVIVIAGSPTRMAERYGARAEQFTLNEVGHAGQNLQLMAASMNLGSVIVGGFTEEQVSTVLHLPSGEIPYYLVPVGVPGE